jgi:glycosyltransferase involved in cell wall biosynthesis
VQCLHAVLPEGVDDPERPSGGNVYDRRVLRGLEHTGWTVHERSVPGEWPWADARARRTLRDVLGSVPDGGTVLVDGLVASATPEVVVPEATRLRLCVLLHLPLGAASDDGSVRAGERAVLLAAAAVVTTSEWSRCWLVEHYGTPADRVHVAEPGVDLGGIAPASPAGNRLLCVAAVTPGKGHDVLLEALSQVRDLPWHCTVVGTLRRDPAHVERLRALAEEGGIAGRVDLAGPRSGAALEESYAGADLLVLPTRFESYGMVVTEALARGVPVLTTAVGGLPTTVGRLTDGTRPGLLVAPDDADALAGALRRWLCDAGLRGSMRSAARARRTTLTGWDLTTAQVARALAGATT